MLHLQHTGSTEVWFKLYYWSHSYAWDLDNQGYPYIWPSHYCKDGQITSLKLFLIVTHFVNFNKIFPKKFKLFSKKKLKRFKKKSLKMQPFLSELPFHIHDWLIITFKDFVLWSENDQLFAVYLGPTFFVPAETQMLRACLLIWFWFINQQDSLTNMFADALA